MKSNITLKRMLACSALLSIVIAGLWLNDFWSSAESIGISANATGHLIYAGIAEVTEVNIVPTDEEIQAIRDSWYAPGSLVMARVNDSVNVRLEPSEESERVGKLYRDCGGYIIEYTDSWTKITSGNVVGWVRNDYLMFGEDAEKEARDVGIYHATITTETLRVRKEPSTEAEVYGLVPGGDVFEIIDQTDGWVVINFEGAEGYVNTEYVDITFHIDHGETMEEIEEREAAEEAARIPQPTLSNGGGSSPNTTTQLNETQYSAYITEASDVVLLGALIQCEAGNQPYEGQVAVGAVVMNRVRSGAYPNSIYGVIFASGQFTPAGSGAVARRIANGVSASCLQAAQAAIDGYSNVGDATHFRPTGRHDGIVIAGHVFW